MSLKTNLDGRKLYILRRKSTSEILKRNVVYPNAVDDAVIEGGDPDLEYLAIDEDAKPDFDPRTFNLTSAEAKAGGVWKISYSTAKRPKQELIAAIQNRKAMELQKIVQPTELAEITLLMLGVLIRKTKGLALNQEEQAIIDRGMDVAAKLWANLHAAAAQETVIQAGGEPDYEAAWAPLT